MPRTDEKPRIRVVAAVLEAGPGAPPCPAALSHADGAFGEGRFLLARKGPGKRLAGLWELPGGKIEVGESPEEALVREIGEELGLEVVAGAYVATSTFDYDFAVIILEAWRGTITGGAWRLTDHDGIAWVDATNAARFEVAPADIPLIAALVEGQ